MKFFKNEEAAHEFFMNAATKAQMKNRKRREEKPTKKHTHETIKAAC